MSTSKQELIELKLEDIVLPDLPFQLRNYEVETQLADFEDLAQSVRQHGVVDPIRVWRRRDGRYEVLGGARTFLAAREVGLPTIPAIVKQVSELEARILALQETLTREHYWGHIACYLIELERKFGPIDAGRVLFGKLRTYYDTLKKLDPRVVEAFIETEQLEIAKAMALATLDNGEQQFELASKAIREGWTVQRLRIEVKIAKGEAERFDCPYCSFFATDKRRLDAHIQERHQRAPPLGGDEVALVTRRAVAKLKVNPRRVRQIEKLASDRMEAPLEQFLSAAGITIPRPEAEYELEVARLSCDRCPRKCAVIVCCDGNGTLWVREAKVEVPS